LIGSTKGNPPKAIKDIEINKQGNFTEERYEKSKKLRRRKKLNCHQNQKEFTGQI